MDGLPILAMSVSSTYLLRKIITRHRWANAVLVLLFIILMEFGLVYCSLYADSRQGNMQRKTTVDSLALIEEKHNSLARQAAFLHLLDWRQRDQLPASPVLELLGASTREAVARHFLTDATPLSEGITDFRASLQDEPFFSEFVIAEHHFKHGGRQAAYQHYRRCLSETGSTGEDQLIRTRVHLRLSDLSDQGMGPGAP